MAQGAFWNNWKNQAIPASGTTVSSTRTSGAYSGFQGGTTGGDNVAVDPYVADVLSMSDADRLAASRLLKAAGYLKYETSKYNKALGDAYREAANDWAVEAARTGRTGLTLKDFLQENVIPTTGRGGAGGISNIPTRSVYQYTPEQLDAKISELANSLLGRELVAADKEADWYKGLNKALNKMIAKGTVSTTKRVKNPKTGKLETVVTQTPEVTAEAIQQKITGALTAADPVSIERKKNLDFANWAFDKMGGGR